MGILISTAGWGPDLRYAFQNNQGSSFGAPTRGLAIHFHNSKDAPCSRMFMYLGAHWDIFGVYLGIYGYILIKLPIFNLESISATVFRYGEIQDR